MTAPAAGRPRSAEPPAATRAVTSAQLAATRAATRATTSGQLAATGAATGATTLATTSAQLAATRAATSAQLTESSDRYTRPGPRATTRSASAAKA